MDVAIKTAEEKQKEAYSKKSQKKFRNVSTSNDEVLLLNMRKPGRKRRRMEPDFSGSYTIGSVCGKLATLKN